MNKEMIVSSNGHETRVAILEDGQLAHRIHRDEVRPFLLTLADVDEAKLVGEPHFFEHPNDARGG